MPVLGSGFDASMASLNEAGEPAAKIGTLIMVMCCKPPPARRNSRAIPRGAGAASGTSGLPPPSENRATTGMALPVNNGERLSAAASAVPTNSPAAHVPLMWFLRWPGCTPKVPSNDSIICWGVMVAAAVVVVVAGAAPANIEAVETVADARVRNANRVPLRKMDDFMKGPLLSRCLLFAPGIVNLRAGRCNREGLAWLDDAALFLTPRAFGARWHAGREFPALRGEHSQALEIDELDFFRIDGAL